MSNNERISFIYIIDAVKVMQSIIRSFEISKKLVRQNVFPIIFTLNVRNNLRFKYNIITEIPESLKQYESLFFEVKKKYLIYFLDNLFKILFCMQIIPFLYFKVKRILKKNKNIKFIYASGPYFHTHIIGFFLKKKFNLPLIVEYRDPWSFNPYSEKKKIQSLITLKIEKKILKFSDAIVAVSPALITFLRKHFPFIKNKPAFSISHGLNLTTFNLNFIKNPQKIVFTYTGTLYVKRNITPLLKIISELKKENFFKNFEFSIKIFGNYPGIDLEGIIKKLHVENLIFCGVFVPREEAFKEVIKSDMAIHIGENLNYPTIAFKVWDYVSCRKKIIYLGREDSYTADFLKENELGVVIPINNLNKGKVILKNLINDLRNNKFNNVIDERKLIEYSWDSKAKQFIDDIVKNFVK